MRLCPVLDAQTEQHDIAGADLGVDDGAVVGDHVLAQQPAAAQHVARWVVGRRGDALRAALHGERRAAIGIDRGPRAANR
jgi:hypothetical protein